MADMCGYSDLSFGENIKADKDLKPCPFCGKQAFLQIDSRYPDDVEIKAYEVVCMNKKCIIYRCDKNYYRSKKQAVEAWNRRTEPKYVERSKGRTAHCEITCVVCGETISVGTINSFLCRRRNTCPYCGAIWR